MVLGSGQQAQTTARETIVSVSLPNTMYQLSALPDAYYLGTQLFTINELRARLPPNRIAFTSLFPLQKEKALFALKLALFKLICASTELVNEMKDKRPSTAGGGPTETPVRNRLRLLWMFGGGGTYQMTFQC